MEGTPYAQTLKNTNHSVEGDIFGIDGINGLKTGSSDTAGYNYIASYKKDGVELVEVVLGVGKWPNSQSEFNRHKYGNAILKYVLRNFEQKILFNAGVQTIQGKKVKVNEPITLFVEKGKEPEFRLTDLKLTLATPFGTLNNTEYIVEVIEVDSNEKESTVDTNSENNGVKKSFVEENIESLKKVPLILWIVIGIAFVILIFLHMTLVKIRLIKRKKF